MDPNLIDIAQIKGKGNGPVADKYRPMIKDFLNSQADNIKYVGDAENVGLHRPQTVLSEGATPYRQKVIDSILAQSPDVSINFEELKNHVGNRFYSSPEEVASSFLNYLNNKPTGGI